MIRTIIATAFMIAVATPAFAAVKYFVVKDTVNNCSVVEAGVSAGLTPIGNKDGYDSEDAAKKALDEVRDDCAGVVE